MSDVNKYLGPGIWYVIHIQALMCTTQSKQQEYCRFLRGLLLALPCKMCVKHATEYLLNHPPEDDIMKVEERIKGKFSMFRYTWVFHNFVNRSLVKKRYSFDDAYEFYSTRLEMRKEDPRVEDPPVQENQPRVRTTTSSPKKINETNKSSSSSSSQKSSPPSRVQRIPPLGRTERRKTPSEDDQQLQKPRIQSRK